MKTKLARGLTFHETWSRFAAPLHALRALRGAWVLLALPAFFGTLLVLSVWSATWFKLEQTRATLEASFQAAAKADAAVYAQHLVRSIEQIDQFTRFVKHDRERGGDPAGLARFVGHGSFIDAPRHVVFLADREGTPYAAAGSTVHKGMVAGEEYFRYHRDHADPAMRISPPALRKSNGRQVIYLSRRLERAGAFDGVVLVILEPTFFMAPYDAATLGRSGVRAMLGSDGVVRAAAVGGSPLAGQGGLARAQPPLALPAASEPPQLENWFADGKPRWVARAPVGRYPYLALVGLAHEEMLAQYRRSETLYVAIAWIATAVLACVALLLTAVVAKSLLNRVQQEQDRSTYRVATDGANEGFAIFRAVRDAGGRPCDFIVVDCNDRGAACLGLSRHDAMGRGIAAVHAETGNPYYRSVLDHLQHAMDTGFVEDEYKLPPESPFRTGWLNRRFVRSGDGLALTMRDITDAKQYQEELSRIANEDPLTCLPNRHSLIRFLPQALAQAHESQHMLSLLFIDLDNFKHVNDTQGHAAGDALLRQVAQRLKAALRPQDFIARQGGDEFTVVLERIACQDECAQLAQKLIAALQAPIDLSGASAFVGASIGISLFPRDGMTADTLLKHSDIAMYHAKAAGKGHYCFYQPSFAESLQARVSNERALQQAIAVDQFALVYQPRVNTHTGELLSLEALVRWIHPERGLVSPLEFIPLAEETGQIVALGELVLEKACAQVAQWRKAGLPLVPVAINVSPRQFADSDVTASFAHALARHGLEASLIEIEVTESSMMTAQHEIADALTEIRALGIKLLVDDFGTGYSSLSQLLRLEMDVLKVDRSFTAELGRAPQGVIFFKAIVSMAHSLGMYVVAEGVETEHQLHLLQHLGCDEVQGYLISRPQPPEQIPGLLRKRFLLPQGSAAPQLALALAVA